MGRHRVFDYGLPGRPEVPLIEPPKDVSRLISRLNALMLRLDDRGWYFELAKRQRREYLKANPQKGRPIRDPLEMDRVMCRTDVVQECKNEKDIEVALFNKRVVLAIDPNCRDEILFEKVALVLKQVRNKPARKINTRAWAKHRILALCDLINMGYHPSKRRKQLAAWLFPESRPQSQGDKFDRAVQYLHHAISVVPALRAQSSL